MNIQIFGKSKCFDTKKAERYFKERGIKVQLIDVAKFGMSQGEFNNIKQAVGGWEKLLDGKTKDKDLLALTGGIIGLPEVKKLLENPKLFKTPIVRSGKKATVGYEPKVWETWD